MIQVKNLHKGYFTERGEVTAVRGVDFEVAEGEIFMLLGPSGCGKTTTLRSIAGLETPDAGEIWLGGQVAFADHGKINVPVYLRGVGMVFQSYAIWPHLTVFENVAYPLLYGIFKVPKSEVKGRVERALSLVGLEGYESRPAPLLSGGQQQRVALARSLVYEPKVLLLDEPLSNLDAKLREEMRIELRLLMKRLKLTALYVTHDQEEALVLSDRIAVMHEGQITQIGSPREIYLRPRNEVVAGFIGSTNILNGCFVEANPEESSKGMVRTPIGTLACSLPQSAGVGQSITIIFRPEDVVVHDSPCDRVQNTFRGKVDQAVFVGSRLQCEIIIGTHRIRAEAPKTYDLEPGQEVLVEIPAPGVHLLP